MDKNNPFTAHVDVAETDWMLYIMSSVVLVLRTSLFGEQICAISFMRSHQTGSLSVVELEFDYLKQKGEATLAFRLKILL